MKISREFLNAIDFEFKNGLIISLYQEWNQFFNIKKFNWCDINFIQIQFEHDRQCGDYEFTFGLLGLVLRIRIPNETEKSKDFYAGLKHETDLIKTWKSVWINTEILKRLKKEKSVIIKSKRPKKFKNYKRCYLQIGD